MYKKILIVGASSDMGLSLLYHMDLSDFIVGAHCNQGRIRLDKNDELFVPSEFSDGKPLKASTILEVKKALKLCRKDLIYAEPIFD